MTDVYTADETIKIRQNLDTDTLKQKAIFCMVLDHVGKVFFPDNIFLAIIGRIAFPLFAYCLVVGCLYTHNVKRYLLRLGIFAVVSQPFYNMAFHPTWSQFWEEFFSLNIFFTLLAGVLLVTALMDIKKRWWMALIAIASEFFIGLDYGLYGLILMSIFYLCRNKSWLSALLSFAYMCISGIGGDFVTIGPIGLDKQFFAVLALPPIYIRSPHAYPKINKYFFYAFYPAHLLIIFIIRKLLNV